jgi:hypothetical protein
MSYDPDDPGIPTLTTRVTLPGPKQGHDTGSASPPRDESSQPPPHRPAGLVPAPQAPAPGPERRVAITGALQAILEAEVERAVARALDDAIDEVRARLEREIPALVQRALARAGNDA